MTEKSKAPAPKRRGKVAVTAGVDGASGVAGAELAPTGLVNEHGLRPQEEAFATELATGATRSDAYRKAFPGALHWQNNAIWVEAPILAASPTVRLRVRELMAAAAAANDVTVALVVKRIAAVAFADARELSAVHRCCCRYCWGDGFPFDLTELRCLDDDLLGQALVVIKMDSRPQAEVHELLQRRLQVPMMGARFELLACRWRLKGRCRPAEAAELSERLAGSGRPQLSI